MSASGSTRAASAGAGKKEHNTVHEDAIWRQLIKYELDWARSWERKWGFMKEKSSNHNIAAPLSEQNIHAIGLPVKASFLVDEKTYNFNEPVHVPDHILHPEKRKPGKKHPETEPFTLPHFKAEEMKSFYLLTHQTRKLQLLGGLPDDKYSYPPTRSNEIGWWTASAKKELRGQPEKRNTLIDAKLGRWARGQGDVYKWYGGSPK